MSRTDRTLGFGVAVVSAIVLCAMAAAGQENGAGREQITNWETPGNLAGTNPLSCVAAETVSTTDTAADIASGARTCLDEGDYEGMADLLLVANVYAYYDTLRVADHSAHAALGALFVDRFAGISKSQADSYWNAFHALIGDDKRLRALCTMLSALGPPEYRPTYMIAHGLGAFSGEREGLREVDTAAGWQEALGYAKCPGLARIETSPSDFNTSVDEPVAVDEAGVDRAVIAAPGKEDKTPPEADRNAAHRSARVGAEPAGVGAVESTAATYGAGHVFRDRLRSGGEGPEMVVIPSGRFRMGCVSGLDCFDREKPVREISIPRAFALSVHEVTFAQWEACAGAGACDGYLPHDRGWGRGNRPVISVSWEDAQSYVSWLSRETGESYRLPSEAEWEYAARAGSGAKYSWGNEIGVNRANCNGCGSQWSAPPRQSSYLGRTAPVGSFAPNAFGLYDMHGNVWEWVEDCWNHGYSGAPSNGSAWLSGDCAVRILRGGSWSWPPTIVRAAMRSGGSDGLRYSFLGFRAGRTLNP